MYRTHHCGALSAHELDKNVVLAGWVLRTRDHGGVNFLDLRDRWGVTQIVFNPELDASLHKLSQTLRSEYCVQVKGKVARRPQGTENEKLSTGQIEVIAKELKILSVSETPPFAIDTDDNLSDELRLKYRYVDLRRDAMRHNLVFRNNVIFEIRHYLHKLGFVDVETPILTKSTPEGARDYLVPSRIHPGQFFALPQSPQLFKQILMVSGFDRYYQIAKCFRDEDLRSDRQPEFTQLDMEMSFVEPKDVYDVIEKLLKHVFKVCLGKDLVTPITRLSYAAAMSRYGCDKPDLRFELPMTDLNDAFKNTSLKIFRQALDENGLITALHVHKPKRVLSRKDLDDLVAYAKEIGAQGLAYLKVTDSGFESPIAKFITPEEEQAVKSAFKDPVMSGDLIFLGAGSQTKRIRTEMGQIRLKLARVFELASPESFAFAWVDEFPLFQYNEDAKRWDSEHHPFTSPHPDDASLLGKDNGKVRSLSYDLVLNGNEIASGSIRIHDAELQRKIFETIGLEKQETEERFGFLLGAFRYGPPPHGGVAIGIDRFVMILLGLDTIRDVIAFPKTQKALCLMTDAPSPVAAKQLKELGIKVA